MQLIPNRQQGAIHLGTEALRHIHVGSQHPKQFLIMAAVTGGQQAGNHPLQFTGRMLYAGRSQPLDENLKINIVGHASFRFQQPVIRWRGGPGKQSWGLPEKCVLSGYHT